MNDAERMEMYAKGRADTDGGGAGWGVVMDETSRALLETQEWRALWCEAYAAAIRAGLDRKAREASADEAVEAYKRRWCEK